MPTLMNKDALAYSFEHRQAIAYIAQKRFGNGPLYPLLQESIKYHDLDKMYLYTLVDKKSASAYHKATSEHHLENGRKMSKLQLLEAVCDWECAAYTKPDKPNNAFDALMRIRPKGYKNMLNILCMYGMDESYEIRDDESDWKDFCGRRKTTIECIKDEISMYRHDRPFEAARIEEAAFDIMESGIDTVLSRFSVSTNDDEQAHGIDLLELKKSIDAGGGNASVAHMMRNIRKEGIQ